MNNLWYNNNGDDMNILKKENWWVWLLLFLFSGGASMIVLGALLNLYNKNEWYAKLKYWIIGVILIIPFSIMITVFNLEITSKTAAKLDVKGSEYYLSPYIWIILLIIPIIGWIIFVILVLYLNICILINLSKGKAEKYIN